MSDENVNSASGQDEYKKVQKRVTWADKDGKDGKDEDLVQVREFYNDDQNADQNADQDIENEGIIEKFINWLFVPNSKQEEEKKSILKRLTDFMMSEELKQDDEETELKQQIIGKISSLHDQRYGNKQNIDDLFRYPDPSEKVKNNDQNLIGFIKNIFSSEKEDFLRGLRTIRDDGFAEYIKKDDNEDHKIFAKALLMRAEVKDPQLREDKVNRYAGVLELLKNHQINPDAQDPNHARLGRLREDLFQKPDQNFTILAEDQNKELVQELIDRGVYFRREVKDGKLNLKFSIDGDLYTNAEKKLAGQPLDQVDKQKNSGDIKEEAIDNARQVIKDTLRFHKNESSQTNDGPSKTHNNTGYQRV